MTSASRSWSVARRLVRCRLGVGAGPDADLRVGDRAPRAAGARRLRDRHQRGRRPRRLVQPPRRPGRRRKGAPPARTSSGSRTARPGRPARLSRAFGVDGRKTEAIVIGLWVRRRPDPVRRAAGRGARPDHRLPRRAAPPDVSRGSLGPWTSRKFANHGGWTRVAKRIAVPPATRDAIMSVGPARRDRRPRRRRPDDRPRPVGAARDDQPGQQRRLRAGRPRPDRLGDGERGAVGRSPATARARRSS